MNGSIGKKILTRCNRCERFLTTSSATYRIAPITSNNLFKRQQTFQSDETFKLNNSISLIQCYSTNQNEPKEIDNKKEEPKKKKNLSIFERYKKAYKEYGKILVGVHIATSSVWFGSFYYAAVSGVDVIAIMKWMGVKEGLISAFSNPAYGNLAVAYLLYKVATPARYTVTIGGTHWTVKQLRSHGYLPPRDKNDNIRELMKASREKVKVSMVNRASRVSRNIEKRKLDIKGNAYNRITRLTSSAKNRARSMSSQVRVRVNRISSNIKDISKKS